MYIYILHLSHSMTLIFLSLFLFLLLFMDICEKLFLCMIMNFLRKESFFGWNGKVKASFLMDILTVKG
jgi:hypothetical protein